MSIRCIIVGLIIMINAGLATQAQPVLRGEANEAFDEIFPPAEGISRVRLDSLFGFIGPNGQLLVRPQFDEASDFREGRARVASESKAGFIDQKGQSIIPLIYDRAWSFVDGVAMIRLQGLYGFLDKSGKPVVPVQFPYAQSSADSMMLVALGGRYGYLDTKGSWRILPQYDAAWPFFKGKAKVQTGPVTFYINKNGECVLGCDALEQEGLKKN